MIKRKSCRKSLKAVKNIPLLNISDFKKHKFIAIVYSDGEDLFRITTNGVYAYNKWGDYEHLSLLNGLRLYNDIVTNEHPVKAVLFDKDAKVFFDDFAL